MATAQIFKQSHPGLGIDSQVNNWQNNRYGSVSGAYEQPSTSDGSAQTSSIGSQGMPSSVIPAAAPVPAPRVQRRRGCQHCITCSGLQHHCHSPSVRSSESPAAEWWPGGIHSPIVYYHLRARQLRYAQKFPQQAGVTWRGPREVHTQQSALLNRRKQGPLAVLVPSVYTNVNQNDASVHYVGDKVVKLTTKPATIPAVPRPAPPPPAAAAIPVASAAAVAAMKRGIETPVRPPRSTWSHPSDSTDNVLISRRSSGSSITTCGMALDPKRRCTEQGGTNFLPVGHFIARTSPPSMTTSPPRVYSGIVMQQHHQTSNNNTSPSQQAQLHPDVFSFGSSFTSAPLMGVITPPVASMAPLSAGSDSSSTSVAPMSTGSADGAAPWSAPMPTHAAAVWELTSASAQAGEAATVPVLSMVHNHYNPYHRITTTTMHDNSSTVQIDHQDPTMQQYYTRQYNIKQEQAFPCHQIVEIGPNTISSIGGYNSFGSNASNAGQAEPSRQVEDDEEDEAAATDVGGWAVGLLRSLAGSIKRSVSP